MISGIGFPVSRELQHGGMQRVVYALAKELQSLGTKVTVCCPGDSDELEGVERVQLFLTQLIIESI